jgi:hypothetical protein
MLDVMAIRDGLPALAIEEAPRTNGGEPTAADMEQQVKLADVLLRRCVVSPRLLEDSPVDIPDGAYPLVEIPAQERLLACNALMEEAGLLGDVKDRFAPLSVARMTSSSSTDSPADTGSGLAISSEATGS